ncbi:hypothetical protein BJV74DRAFT_987051 [Russula compacta]|nr:hypothetical protein BJV74DRAFT_987051 [Russula compacta]
MQCLYSRHCLFRHTWSSHIICKCSCRGVRRSLCFTPGRTMCRTAGARPRLSALAAGGEKTGNNDRADGEGTGARWGSETKVVEAEEKLKLVPGSRPSQSRVLIRKISYELVRSWCKFNKVSATSMSRVLAGLTKTTLADLPSSAFLSWRCMPHDDPVTRCTSSLRGLFTRRQLRKGPTELKLKLKDDRPNGVVIAVHPTIRHTPTLFAHRARRAEEHEVQQAAAANSEKSINPHLVCMYGSPNAKGAGANSCPRNLLNVKRHSAPYAIVCNPWCRIVVGFEAFPTLRRSPRALAEAASSTSISPVAGGGHEMVQGKQASRTAW